MTAPAPVPAHIPRRGAMSRLPIIPFLLIALVVIPAIAGSLRLLELAGGPLLLPANPRMTASPIPVFVHVIAAVAYAVLGAFQFFAPLRRDHPAGHRAAGRPLIPLGLAVAASGLWMTLVYARQPGTGDLAYLFRLTFGSGMAVAVVLGWTTIRRRDVRAHRAWMTRAYALALAAGTQTVTQGLAEAFLGSVVLARDLGLGAGWVINLAVAEVVIRRAEAPRTRARRSPPLRRTPSAAS